MDILTIILGSAGLFSLIQYLITRHDKKHDQTAKLKSELDKVSRTLDQTVLRVTRIELTNLIRNDPHNIEAITSVAKYYFIDLDGDAYIHTMFERWADAEGVNTEWLPAMRNKGKEA